ncbi:restriction endonuclease subunit S [Deinococcus puniceus]|uniref:restriction endonuclease subunit S n=1 Tax=Deinococcus puniceus TaxID=1182568 RepID=UPI0012F94A3B|nr:restriction endonuclease subunit S [Deinococcus puniceus]
MTIELQMELDLDIETVHGEGLPEGWAKTTLGEVCFRLVDGSHNPPKGQSEGLPMLSARNIQNSRINFEEYRLISEKDFELENRRTNINIGDVLLTIVGAIGRTAVVPEGLGRFTLQRSVAVLKPQNVVAKYLAYVLDSPITQTFFEANARGTAQKGIYLKALAETPFPLPPLPEQLRIADKLETLLSRVDAGRERLERVPRLIKRFRQAVLSAAVSGELTREWRGGGDAEWEETSAQQAFSSVRDGTHDTPKYVELGIPLITSKNIRSWGLDFGDVKYISENDHLEISKRSAADKEDILISMIGTIGNVCIIDTDNVFSIKNVGLFKKGIHNSRYLEIYLKSPQYQNFLIAEARGGTQKFVSLGVLRSSPILLPPLPEQLEIVRRVESLFAFADRLEARYASALSSFNRLTPALLAKAFRGELVAQDPNDEPALVLLERIRAQRAATTPKGKSKTPAKAKVAAGGGELGAEGKRRGRPPGAQATAAPTPTAASYDEAVRKLQELGQARAEGTRQVSLFED